MSCEAYWGLPLGLAYKKRKKKPRIVKICGSVSLGMRVLKEIFFISGSTPGFREPREHSKFV
jgi:hypothetical protein